MNTIKPDIIAAITMYTPENGGKSVSISGVQVRCPFAFEEKMYDCRILLDQVKAALTPGETSEVPIKFLYSCDVVPRLSVGFEFKLWEMGYFASGTILEILKKDDHSNR